MNLNKRLHHDYLYTCASVLINVHVTCLIAVSSVTTVSRCGGGGGEVRTTLVSLTTGSEVASGIVAHVFVRIHLYHFSLSSLHAVH